MWAGNDGHITKGRPQGLSIASPEDGHAWTSAAYQRLDGAIGHALPAASSMRARLARLHREDPVEQEHALVCPGGQVAVVWGCDAEIGFELAIDVGETARERTHGGCDREREPDRVSGRRVRVLADDEHPDVAKGTCEGPQNGIASREESAAGGVLGAQEVTEFLDGRCGRLEGVGPVRRNQFGQRCWAHPGYSAVPTEGVFGVLE